MIIRIGMLLTAGVVLAGCGETIRPATVYQGECRLFDDPGFRVRGLTTADKRWIATTQEKGIQVCGWQRPANMPEPAAAQALDCSTVHQVVGLFGGDVAKAEAYAVSQGATPEHIVAARQCLTQPVVVKAKKKSWFRGKKRAVSFSQKTFEPAVVALPTPRPIPVAMPTPVATPAPVPAPVVVATPAAAGKKCKPRKYRWQYWRPKSCP